MLPTTSADHTRFSLRKGSTAATWDTVKGIEWNRLYVAKFADFRNSRSGNSKGRPLARIVLTSTSARGFSIADSPRCTVDSSPLPPPRAIPGLVCPLVRGVQVFRDCVATSHRFAAAEGSTNEPAPKGAKELSPALQRWVEWKIRPSPVGTTEVATQSLRVRTTQATVARESL
jgi:hypothetical protein